MWAQAALAALVSILVVGVVAPNEATLIGIENPAEDAAAAVAAFINVHQRADEDWIAKGWRDSMRNSDDGDAVIRNGVKLVFRLPLLKHQSPKIVVPGAHHVSGILAGKFNTSPTLDESRFRTAFVHDEELYHPALIQFHHINIPDDQAWSVGSQELGASKLDLSGDRTSLPEHCSPLECSEESKSDGDDDQMPVIRRLLAGIAGFVGGYFVSLWGCDQFDRKRRAIGASLVILGALSALGALGLVIALDFPATWGWPI